MDRKEALKLVTQMIDDHAQTELNDVLRALRNKAEELRSNTSTKLSKSIEEAEQLAKSDEKGVHQTDYSTQYFAPKGTKTHTQHGVSTAGIRAREARNPSTFEEYDESPKAAKQIHREKLSDLKSMPKPNLPKSEDMKKIDPNTKLPGTMLDKVVDGGLASGGTLGAMGAMAPTLKNSPDQCPPMMASEDSKVKLAQWMKKCMKSLQRSDGPKEDHQQLSEKLDREPSQGELQDQAGDKQAHAEDMEKGSPFNLSASDKSLKKINFKLERPSSPKDPVANYGKVAPKPASPQNKAKIENFTSKIPKMQKGDTVRPDAGFGSVTVKDSAPSSPGSVVMKDNKPHPAGSPEDKAHDIVEEGQPVQDAVSDLGSRPEIKKMFEHLRNRQSEGKSWERSPKNEAVGMDKSEFPQQKKPELMSEPAKGAIIDSSDKPIKIEKERPGQANEPSKK